MFGRKAACRLRVPATDGVANRAMIILTDRSKPRAATVGIPGLPARQRKTRAEELDEACDLRIARRAGDRSVEGVVRRRPVRTLGKCALHHRERCIDCLQIGRAASPRGKACGTGLYDLPQLQHLNLHPEGGRRGQASGRLGRVISPKGGESMRLGDERPSAAPGFDAAIRLQARQGLANHGARHAQGVGKLLL